MKNGTNKISTDKVSKALASIEKYFVGVIPWLANMYDPNTHGFYMTVSGMKDPEMEPAIEMTAWGISLLYNYTSALDSAPQEFHRGVIDFICDRQDERTGLFIDKQGPTNARETARNQSAAHRALVYLNGKKRYPHPSDKGSSDAVKAADMMPAYMESVDTYIAWLSSMDWDNKSWGAGDQTQSSQRYIAMLPPDTGELYKSAAIEWLGARQCENGLWSPSIDFNSASGAFKVGLVYGEWKMRLPNYDKIIDSIFECYRVAKSTNPYYIRNPISVLASIASYSPEAKEKIQRLTVENLDVILESFGDFLCPDGAFSAHKGSSMVSFGGVVGSHGLYEGDIDATAMMLVARRQLYEIFDMKAPLLNTDNFWDWISGKLPMPEPHIDFCNN